MGRVALGIVLVLASPAALAQLTKCIDERGRTHYTDKPIPGCKPVATARDLAPPPPIATQKPAAAPQAAVKPGAAAKPGAATRPAPKLPLTEKEKEQLASNCKSLREQHAWLTSPRGAGVENHAARVGQVERAMRACPP